MSAALPCPSAPSLPPPPLPGRATVTRDLLAAGRRLARRLADAEDRDALLTAATEALADELGFAFAAVSLRDSAARLVARAQSGRLAGATLAEVERLLVAVAGSGAATHGALAGSACAFAVPLRGRGRVLGALLVAGDNAGDAALEDAVVLVAAHLAAMVAALPPRDARAAPAGARAAVVRRYAANDSVFVDDQYLIKGVAGSILWKLLSEHQALGRRCFTNKELRVDPALRLPEFGDNLEARLVLLRRRLAAQGAPARIERTGRGRYELRVERPFRLVDVA
jgi:hypothetical protein